LGEVNGVQRGYLLTPVQPPITILSPSVEDLWVAGGKGTIRWSAPGIDLVDIYYSTNYENGSGTFIPLTASHPADSGQYLWAIPDTILSRKCAVSVEDASNPKTFVESGVFRIKGYELTRIDGDSNYERFLFDEDRWSFGNSRDNMWPSSWWGQFNYLTGIDPYTGDRYPTSWPNGWPFYIALPDDFPDWPLFVQGFGTDQCYWSVSAGIYSIAAKRLWGVEKKTWGGSCAGFAVSSLLFFVDKEGMRNRYPGIPNTQNLVSVPLDTTVRNTINELWFHWWGAQHQSYVWGVQGKSPTETVHDLKEVLIGDSPSPGYLYLRNNDGGGAHAVVAYKVTSGPGASQYSIHVYDNSWPTTPTASIVVDTAAHGGAGSWSSAQWSTWGGSAHLFLMDPPQTYLEPPVTGDLPEFESPAEGGAGIRIFPSTTASILIQDPDGNQMGWSDSLVIESIPGAFPIIPPTGSETPPYSYDLEEGAYSIEMDEFTTGESSLSVFSDSEVFTVLRTDALPGQTDRFHYDGTFSVMNHDGEPKEVTVGALLIDGTESEKDFWMANCIVQQNDSLNFMLHDDSYHIVNSGSEKSYDLHLELASADENLFFGAPGVGFVSGSAHTIVPDWSDLTVVPIHVDLDNNGTVDDTLFVANTVDVDDRGFHSEPLEYTLAQNYPNPFNPKTVIGYSLPERAHVTLKVYTILGQEVATLVDGKQEAGIWKQEWAARGLASGMYLYRLTTDKGFVQTRKMLLVR
jgi:hypothetical protein